MGQIKIDATNLADSLLQGFVSPRITSIVYPTGTATNPAGGETITIKGTGFQYGAAARIAGVAVGVTTVVDFNTITFTAPAKTAGNYALTVLNPDGGMGTSASDLVYSGAPTWSTASGSLGSSYESQTLRTNLSANSDSAITYSLASGTLPAGATLASNGLLSGTLSNVNNATTYSFTLAATDAESQSNTRSFSYLVNTDVVTFSTANNLTMNATQNSAITSNTIVASAASGQTVTYSSSSLPTGISINSTSGAITGTPTTVSNVASIITATANTTNKSANITFNFNIGPYVTPTVTARFLVVAGGGGGAHYYGGGGGAGGVINSVTANLNVGTVYTVLVGAGGGVSSTSYYSGQKGSNSSISGSGFSTLTAEGGGGGGGYVDDGRELRNGGSGGGAGGYYNGGDGYYIHGFGVSGQGHRGGSLNGSLGATQDSARHGAHGGGGASNPGGDNTTGDWQGTYGGPGRYDNISGANTAYAGGGGGGGVWYGSAGVGGVGGGGTAGGSYNTSNSTPGVINTGGGGGGFGGYSGTPLGTGGSGIVILSYPGSQVFTGGTVTTVGSNTVHTFTTSGTLS